MVPQKSNRSKKSEIAVFGGSPKSEEVEHIESPGNPWPAHRRKGGGSGLLEIEKIVKAGYTSVWRVPSVGGG